MNLTLPIETIESFVRREAGINNNIVPVNIVDDSHGPIVVGEAGGYFTRGGNRIMYPSAYSKVGFSNMSYHCEIRMIYVGQTWIERSCTKLLRN